MLPWLIGIVYIIGYLATSRVAYLKWSDCRQDDDWWLALMLALLWPVVLVGVSLYWWVTRPSLAERRKARREREEAERLRQQEQYRRAVRELGLAEPCDCGPREYCQQDVDRLNAEILEGERRPHA